MLAKDFILESSLELQERATNNKKFYSDEELFLKLNKAYKEIQKDLPCFIFNETIDIKQGINLYHLKHKALKGISLFVNNIKYKLENVKYTYMSILPSAGNTKEHIYSVVNKELYISKVPSEKANSQGERNKAKANITYYYYKSLTNENDYLTLPLEYLEALRLLFLSFVFEKATRDSKERDLCVHYLKRYEQKKEEIKRYKKDIKSINTTYQRI